MHYKYPHEFQAATRLALQQVIFEVHVQAILRQVHRITKKDLEDYQAKCTPIMLY